MIPDTPKGSHGEQKGSHGDKKRVSPCVHNRKEPLLTVGETENTDNSEAARKLKRIAKQVSKRKALH